MSPRASVIIPAYNLARYLPAAIDSALAQVPPGGPIEVIVVDDGSTDETPQILARYSDRVRVIRRPNGGLVAAVDTGLAAASGEYIALLDADDEWPRDRLRQNIALLDADPALGLVHGDMEIIDANGSTTHPSFFALQATPPSDGRVLGRLLAANFVSGGASTFRSSLMPAIHPIAPDAAYPDWWLAACIASVAEIRHHGGISNRYRYHGANMGLGAGPDRQAAIHRRELSWRRWMMWHLAADDTVEAQHLHAALETWRFALRAAAAGHSGPADELLAVDPAAARACAAQAPGAMPQGKQLLRAFSRNPFDGALAVDLEVAIAREHGQPAVTPAAPLIALRTRRALTIAWLHEVERRRDLLHAYAEMVRGDDDATLAILAEPQADLAPLIALVDSDPRLSDESCDLIVITEPATTPAQKLLAARAGARLGGGPPSEPYVSLPVHPAAEQVRSACPKAA